MQRENWGSKDRLIQFLFAEVLARCRKGEGSEPSGQGEGASAQSTEVMSPGLPRRGLRPSAGRESRQLVFNFALLPPASAAHWATQMDVQGNEGPLVRARRAADRPARCSTQPSGRGEEPGETKTRHPSQDTQTFIVFA